MLEWAIVSLKGISSSIYGHLGNLNSFNVVHDPMVMSVGRIRYFALPRKGRFLRRPIDRTHEID